MLGLRAEIKRTRGRGRTAWIDAAKTKKKSKVRNYGNVDHAAKCIP